MILILFLATVPSGFLMKASLLTSSGRGP